MNRLLPGLRVLILALAALLIVAAAGTVVPAPASAQNTVASCRVLVPELLVRSGPGTAFPAVGRLTQNTVIQGISFVRTGVPGGSWVEVQQTPGRSLGFMSAEAQFSRCQPAASTLTAGQIPPTPAPSGQRVARTRVNGGDLSDNPVVRGPANVNNGQYIILPNADQRIVDAAIDENGGTARFNDALGFGVEPLDRRAGQTIGSGILEVQFEVTYFDFDQEQEVTAFRSVERTSPYCIFSDANGQCTVLRFSRMGYKWPDTQLARGAPRPTEDTQYTALITIVSRNGDPILWRWQFNLSQIAVEFP